jgi:pyruvate formate lyase activating enzyme
MERIVRFQPYFGREGGLTLSGGEPLLQPEFAMEVLWERCRDAGISTCVDTAGRC